MIQVGHTGGAAEEGSAFAASFSSNACANCGAPIGGKGRIFCPTCSCERHKERTSRHWREVRADPKKHTELLEARRWWWHDRIEYPTTQRFVVGLRNRRRMERRRLLRKRADRRMCGECGRILGRFFVNGRLSGRKFHTRCGKARAVRSTLLSRQRARERLAVAA